MSDPSIYSVRRATPADAVLLAEIGAETFFASFAADNTPEDMAAYLAGSFSPQKQALELADPSTHFLILEDAGVTAGYARLRDGPAHPAVAGDRPVEIVRFYARKPWIGKGAGAFLMRKCLDEARSLGCGVVWLDVWDRNPRAITFYRKWGFVVVGEQNFQLGSELQRDLVMARATVL